MFNRASFVSLKTYKEELFFIFFSYIFLFLEKIIYIVAISSLNLVESCSD